MPNHASRYISCETFSEISGFPIDYVERNFATAYNGTNVVPKFMLDMLNEVVEDTPDLLTEDRISPLGDVQNEKKLMTEPDITLNPAELKARGQIDFDSLDSAFEKEIRPYIGTQQSKNSSENFVEQQHAAVVQQAAKTRQQRKTRRNTLYGFLLIFAIAAAALFVYKYPPAQTLLLNTLTEIGLLREM